MRRRSVLQRLALAIAFVTLVAPAPARSDQPFYYLNPAELDLTVFLPPPPDLTSAQGLSLIHI